MSNAIKRFLVKVIGSAGSKLKHLKYCTLLLLQLAKVPIKLSVKGNFKFMSITKIPHNLRFWFRERTFSPINIRFRVRRRTKIINPPLVAIIAIEINAIAYRYLAIAVDISRSASDHRLAHEVELVGLENRGDDRLEVGDRVILFVHEDEIPTVGLLFPGPER